MSGRSYHLAGMSAALSESARERVFSRLGWRACSAERVLVSGANTTRDRCVCRSVYLLLCSSRASF